MGQFLNKGNRKFSDFSKSKYFVDKTHLINKLLEKDESEKFICNSRARRFGKSVTADMLVAYFSKGADSKELFRPLQCEKNELFVENLNRYDTIFVDIQAQYVFAREKRQEPNQYISTMLVGELQAAYPDIVSENDIIAEALAKIYNATGSQFVVIFDEWDYPIRELDEGSSERAGYNELSDCICPYKHYDAGLIEDVVDGVVSGEDTETEDYPYEGTMKHWRWWSMPLAEPKA